MAVMPQHLDRGAAGAVAVLCAIWAGGCGVERADERGSSPPPARGVAAGAPAAAAAPRAAAEIRPALRREFEGSYPGDAPRASGVREFTIRAAPQEIEIFDGQRLPVWCYNGQVPGPLLRVRLGQSLRVRFENELPQPSTIHWHGVRVPNAMDGVPEVTQPPVPPGGSFVYEFTPKDAGTYWFHPHVRSSEQVERGLYGLLVVEDREPLPYTQDVVWVLDDWRLTADGSRIDPNFGTPGDLAHDGRWGDVITVNGSRRHELTVKAGERIRLRLLDSANGRVFVPDFWRLDATVIAVDGMYVARPFKWTRFEMAPGNRLDLDITFRPEDAGRTIRIYDRFTREPLLLATIRVLQDVVKTPGFPPPAAARIPRWAGAEALAPDIEYVLDTRAGGAQGLEWTLNGLPFASHGGRREVLYLDEWAKIRFVNKSARLHPMHFHGQFFRLLSRNGQRQEEGFWRDTVLVHAKETLEVGLVPLDLGAWMLHCHILEHAEAGMMTVVEVHRRAP